MTGDAGNTGKTLRMGVAKIRQPLVVYANHLGGGFGIVQAHTGAQDAVQDLGLNTIAILVDNS